MLNTEKININMVSLLAACECNLQCAYCAIAKARKGNRNADEIMRKNVEALKDGTYCENVLKVLDRLHQSRYNINDLQIWGQEPTLIIKYLADDWERWYRAFPNLSYIMFSTNGMAHTDDLFNFFVAVDDIATTEIRVNIQISYDGKYGEEKVRGGKSDIIYKNCQRLNELCNSHKFKNIRLDFQLHSVFSNDLIKYLDSMEKILDYFRGMDEFRLSLQDNCINGDVTWGIMSYQFQTGGKYSIEDGFRFTDRANKIDRISKMENFDYFEHSPGFSTQVLGPALRNLHGCIQTAHCHSLDELIDKFLNGEANFINERLYCSTILHDLKIMYDGKVLLCQNHIFDTDIDDEALTDSISDQGRKHFIKSGQSTNFITDSDEKVQHVIDYVSDIVHGGSGIWMYSNTMNLMYLMSQCGQVDPEYCENLDKLKRHAFIAVFLDSCMANLLSATGSTMVRNAATLRFVCNGLIQMTEESLEKEIERCACHEQIEERPCNRGLDEC